VRDNEGDGGSPREATADRPRIRHFAERAIQIILGLPNYNAYVEHIVTVHPGRHIMTREEFYRDRHAARYSGVRGRCC
jgi:uncharacterized short protein YbdD (DUF466 family)